MGRYLPEGWRKGLEDTGSWRRGADRSGDQRAESHDRWPLRREHAILREAKALWGSSEESESCLCKANCSKTGFGRASGRSVRCSDTTAQTCTAPKAGVRGSRALCRRPGRCPDPGEDTPGQSWIGHTI